MAVSIGARVPWRDEHDCIWHVGTVEALRRPPSGTDRRTFARLRIECRTGRDAWVEVNVIALRLMADAQTADPDELCPTCYRSRKPG